MNRLLIFLPLVLAASQALAQAPDASLATCHQIRDEANNRIEALSAQLVAAQAQIAKRKAEDDEEAKKKAAVKKP